MILIPQYRTARRASASTPDLLSNLILSLDLEEASGNALDSSGNSYTFTDTNTVGQTTGQTGGYNARNFVAANNEYFARAHSDTELTIGDNEWACHLWAYNNSAADGAGILAKSSSTTPGTNSARSFVLNHVASELRFAVGLDPAASGDLTIITTGGQFPAGAWAPVLIWHDPNDNVIGIKVGANSAVTGSISTGVRNGASTSLAVGSRSGSGPANAYIAALRIWRGSGVIAQIVDNADAIDFLNAQQRRHSDLT